MTQRNPHELILPPSLDPRRPLPTRRRRAARVLSWIAVLTSIAVLGASAVGFAAFRYYYGKLKRTDIRLPGVEGPGAGADGAAVNFLLVGSDTRDGDNSQYQARPGSAAYVSNARSDTTIFVHIPPGDAKATLISIPRDAWVEIPAWRDAEGRERPAHNAKFNTALVTGGRPLLVHTVETMTGMSVDHYVEVDFAGFKRMVDALHGVDVCVRTARNDRNSGNVLQPGRHHLNGERALAFVRDRDSYADKDITRIRTQQYFMSVVLKKVLSAGTLANPLKLNNFLQALTDSVTVDDDFGPEQMRQLATRMNRLDPAHVTFVTLPFTSSNARRGGQSVVLLDDAAVDKLFSDLREAAKGRGKPAAPQATRPATVAPSSVTVTVLNGSGVARQAATAGTALSGHGFRVAQVGNAPQRVTQSVVRYGDGGEAAARTVAAYVPGATIAADPSVDGVTLILGSNYTGVRAPGGSTPASPRPGTPSASPSRAPTAADLNCAP